MDDQPTQGIESTILTFSSAGRPVTVDWFHAARPGRRPAVLLLHGRDGPDRFTRSYGDVARALARRGYQVLFVRYFESTGDATILGQAGLANFLTWMQTVGDAIGWAAAQSTVDGTRIGLAGVSLGASVALAQASQDTRIGAVIDYYGALPAPAYALVRRMPPTLILHGARDWVVPVSAAYQLDAVLGTLGVPHETHIYPDQGHGFHGAAGTDAMRRTLAFLDQHLAAGKP